jgi:hypothetical protein
MTDVIADAQEALKQQEEKLLAVRHALINNAYQLYLPLQDFIKSLPIPQHCAGIAYAHQFLESGMLWVEKMLLQSPLILNQNQTASVPKIETVEVNEAAA